MFATKALVMRVVVIESRFEVLASRREFKRIGRASHVEKAVETIWLDLVTSHHVCPLCRVSCVPHSCAAGTG